MSSPPRPDAAARTPAERLCDPASGHVLASRAGEVAPHWLALVIGLVSIPIIPSVCDELERGNRAAWIGLVFPLLALGFALRALHLALVRRKYGVARLEARRWPLALGGVARVRVVVPRGVAPTGTGIATLACARTTHAPAQRLGERMRGRRRRFDEVLWTQPSGIAVAQWLHERGSSALELALRVPETPASHYGDDGQAIVRWTLGLDVPARGANLSVRFELPVAQLPAADGEHAPDAKFDVELEALLAECGIRARREPSGAAELELASPTPWSAAIPALACAIGLALFGGALWASGVPGIFACGAWLGGALIGWIASELLRPARALVRIERGELVVRGPGARVLRFPSREILRVRRSGSVGSGVHRFHSLSVDCDFGRATIGGRSHCIARRVEGDLAALATASWIERELRRAA